MERCCHTASSKGSKVDQSKRSPAFEVFCLRCVISVNTQVLIAFLFSPHSMVAIDSNSLKVEEILIWKTLNHVHVMVDEDPEFNHHVS